MEGTCQDEPWMTADQAMLFLMELAMEETTSQNSAQKATESHQHSQRLLLLLSGPPGQTLNPVRPLPRLLMDPL